MSGWYGTKSSAKTGKLKAEDGQVARVEMAFDGLRFRVGIYKGGRFVGGNGNSEDHSFDAAIQNPVFQRHGVYLALKDALDLADGLKIVKSFTWEGDVWEKRKQGDWAKAEEYSGPEPTSSGYHGNPTTY